MKRTLLFFLWIFIGMPLCALQNADSPSALGNFANRRKPLCNFSFGQNVIAKDTKIVYAQFSQENGPDTNVMSLAPLVLYGVTDYFSLFATIPFFVQIQPSDMTTPVRTHGVGDIVLQGEYAYYRQITPEHADEATIVANMTLPTGFVSVVDSQIRRPSTGFGAPSFFLGGTLSRLTKRWYYFLSDGGIITTTPKKGTPKSGNTFFYQGGFGANLGNPGGSTLAIMLELNGILTTPDRINGKNDPNTGGNTIYLGPSFYATKGSWVIFAGIQSPVLQSLNGSQDPQSYRILASISVAFW
jgi:hypothetical protein